MTSQQPDHLVHDGERWEVVGATGEGLFSASDHVVGQTIHTGLVRGHHTTYAVVDGRLVVTAFRADGTDLSGAPLSAATEILGSLPTSADDGSVTYDGVAWPVPFTGALVLGDTWVPDLYVHLGYLPIWKYVRVRRLLVRAGEVTRTEDLTDEIAELRRAIVAGELDEPAWVTVEDDSFVLHRYDGGRKWTVREPRIGPFASRERARAVRWKAWLSAELPGYPLSMPSPFARDGRPVGRSRGFCLPARLADLTLLPGGEPAAPVFAELGIPWHQGIAEGPSNHLLDSQVQCANALAPMMRDPVRIARAFGSTGEIGDVEQIEPGRFLTFEYVGPTDFFGEARPGAERVRGSRCTSVDAAFLHRTGSGTELVLVEWKYTESYRRRPDEEGDATRERRYGRFLDDPAGPIDGALLPRPRYFDEPIYQLTRQQLLAWQLEVAGVADRVRVVHVLSPQNTAYQRSIHHDEHRALGATVSEIWSRLLRHPDRFATLDPAVFLVPEITSPEYVRRYG